MNLTALKKKLQASEAISIDDRLKFDEIIEKHEDEISEIRDILSSLPDEEIDYEGTPSKTVPLSSSKVRKAFRES